MSNFRYSYYAKLDYKSCFNSIYSHSYKWIIERNVIDSKNANHASLFLTIDRILQNINGKSSNGLLVGPEFSRMIAEVLLQQIDNNVKLDLSKIGILHNADYVAFRYVDDIYIFAKTQETINIIISSFSKNAQNYLIQLNELKISKGLTPFLPKEWLSKTRTVADVLSNLFYNDSEYNMLPDDNKFIVKKSYVHTDRIKDDITTLFSTYASNTKTIVSYLLSTLYNNISRKKNGIELFKIKNFRNASWLLDIAFFIYSFYPSYEQSQKIISMIVYINSELCFKTDNANKKKLQTLINRYNFIFLEGNLYDLVDWFVFLLEYNVPLDVKVEQVIIKKVENLNDPILWGNLLLYSSYNKPFHDEIVKLVNKNIETEIQRIGKREIMLHREFWYVLVFHDCPHISKSVRDNINTKITDLRGNSNNKCIDIICNFLELKDSQKNKQCVSFFNWNSEIEMGERITYRTYQRTVFKSFNKKNYYDTSID